MPRRGSWVSGTISVTALLSFVFGLIFVIVMLVLAIAYPNPTPSTQKTFTTVLALAAAGVGATLPGYLQVRHVPFIRAGGAVAMFVIVYFFQGQIVSTVASFPVPKSDSRPAFERLIAAVDSGDAQRIWETMPSGFAAFGISQEEGKMIFESARKPLGSVQNRQIVSTGMSTDIPGFPPGRYKFYQLRTKFSNLSTCRPEGVWVRARDENEWEPFSYQVGMQDIPCV